MSAAPHQSSARTPLRDLTAEQFSARYGCDRFTATVLGNRFRYVNQHMATKLRTNAFSYVIRDMDDFCTTVTGPPELDWAMPAASLTNPCHWGPVTDSARVCLEEYGLDNLHPGDVIVCNDSYRAGKHLNDTSFLRPLFWEDKLIGAVHITAHQIDLGSRRPGGVSVGSETIWEDGLLLPPMLLYDRGTPVRSLFSLLAANSRAPDAILADLLVIRASLDLGEELLLESIRRYGIDAYLGAIRYACDSAEEAMAEAIGVIPDGTYVGENVIESDGLAESPQYAVRLAIRKHGERMEIDFSGTSATSRSAMNCSWLDVKTGLLIALKLLVDRHSPPNSASMRHIDIVLPPDCIVNPQPPASTMYYFALIQAIIRATLDALNPVLGQNAVGEDCGCASVHHAQGRKADGTRWGGPMVEGSVVAAAWGATAGGDGDCNSLLIWMNYPDTGVEVKELAELMVVMRVEPACDTGGPGYHRGGAGMLTDICWRHGGFHNQFTTQVATPPRGAFGGGGGKVGGEWLFDREQTGANLDWLSGHSHSSDYAIAQPMGGLLDPVTNELALDGEYVFHDRDVFASAGSVARSLTNGAGGWGNPVDRPIERVLRDVRDGYVSLACAETVYGVAIVGDPESDPEGLEVDEAATRALRARSETPASRPCKALAS